ncbi:EAL domain-containing protein [Crenobacter sp. SG2305]|uniref:putative bifunctional diguanylate cyclase/phosphodiesterase n=1 Tax=Crenobacter oryzisoli TaxID=3056844 RepID=UPI0025AA394F|nr:EAL domain-containing protein [Crenobacter sp. SG2305]MDN0081861.1 EAL domain-containing protein [Crenobacter sp. SG2305]
MVASYDLLLVALSYLVAAMASYTALSISGRLGQAKQDDSRYWRVGGAIVMGTGIWSMHFTGMLAFQLPVALGYDIVRTLLSWLLALGACWVALSLLSRHAFRWRSVLAGGGLMGLGISAMHYTGMAALMMTPAITYRPGLFALSVLVAIGASIAALVICFKLRQARRHLGWYQLLAAQVMALAITGMHYTGMTAAEFAPGAVCGARHALSVPMMATLVVGGSLALLTIAWIVTMLDARLESQTAKLAASLRAANEELLRINARDSLTGLANRRAFEAKLAELQAGGDALSVAFIDLDGFKPVNDSLGHQVGDEVLVAVGQRLAEAGGRRNLLARVGGDEFILLVIGARERPYLNSLASRLIEAVREPIEVGRNMVELSCSIGIASYPTDTDEVKRLIAMADSAMYEVKRSGKNHVRFYSPELDLASGNLVERQRELRNALAQRQFMLYFQPKLNPYSGELNGVEALVRWQHPERGIVAPQEFIPMMERFGLIVELGNQVLELALQALQRWLAADRAIPVAINISPQQFGRDGFAEHIIARLTHYGVPHRLLTLEITETVVMADMARTEAVLNRLREAGIPVSLDDFGTGYSSLSLLRVLAPNELKIDRSFIKDLAQSPAARVIVAPIIEMAHSLGMTVVAEGVENEAQAEVLRTLGCDELQGFHYARPMTGEDFARWCFEQPSLAAVPA